MVWYQQHCDGDWENDYGISIESCDNPGWSVKIDLVGTELESRAFVPMARGDTASLDPQPPWLHCYVKNRVFHGLGDSTTLQEILDLFLGWAQAGPSA